MALVNFRAGLIRSPEPPKLKFSDYFVNGLPPIPATFDRGGLFPRRTEANPYPLGMLGNNTVGNCTIAGPFHIVMLWNKLAGTTVRVTTLDAMDDYRDACGYKFNDPSTDTGGDMLSVAQYWQKTGMRDCTDRRHQIAAYVSIDPTNLDHLIAASYICDGGVGLGLALPENAEDEFVAGRPWSDKASNENLYHFVPLAYRGNDKQNHVYTWGADQPATDQFVADNCREAVGYISAEALRGGKTVEGFAMQDLLNDVRVISS